MWYGDESPFFKLMYHEFIFLIDLEIQGLLLLKMVTDFLGTTVKCGTSHINNNSQVTSQVCSGNHDKIWSIWGEKVFNFLL